MLTSITLQNFKSFGAKQTIRLEPITVLVGPNNSGKSNLVSLARFLRNAATGGGILAFDQEGGVEFVLHRPATGDASLRIGWKVDEEKDTEGSYVTILRRGSSQTEIVQEYEYLGGPKLGEAWQHPGDSSESALFEPGRGWLGGAWSNRFPLVGLHQLARRDRNDLRTFRPVWTPLVHSKEIKLSVSALRQDAQVVPDPRLEGDGSGMAAVLGVWRGANPGRARELDDFIQQHLPEIKHVLVKPGPSPGEQRLWVQQVDGEQFDSAHVSDGVLCFIALAMHVLDAEPGSLLFIEEPEQSIHPSRIRALVELFRTIVYDRKCQLVVVTHSPVLLHELRDEPEAILLFRRSGSETRVNPLTEFPDLMEALTTRKADPGDMLVNGYFNEPS